MNRTDIFSSADALARLRQSVHAKAGNFYSMYSSVLGGIVTDPALNFRLPILDFRLPEELDACSGAAY